MYIYICIIHIHTSLSLSIYIYICTHGPSGQHVEVRDVDDAG